MRRIKDRINKELHFCLHILLDATIIALISLFIVYSFDWSFLDPSSYYQTNSEKGVSADLLQRIGYNGSDNTIDQIIFINIDDIENRKELADILEAIYDKEPAVIGIDVVFRGLKNIEEDSCLIRVVKRIRDKSVFASSISKNGMIRHSFFCDSNNTDLSLKVPGITEGLTSYNIESDKSTIRTYQMKCKIKDSLYLSFSAQMYKLYKKSSEEELSDTTEHYIRFLPMGNIPLSPNDIKNAELGGLVVIVGDFGKGEDVLSTPVGLLHGSEIHAQAFYTISTRNIEDIDVLAKSEYIGSCGSVFFVLSALAIIYYALMTKNTKKTDKEKAHGLGEG